MIVKFCKGLGYALKGILIGIKEERNIRIDIIAILYVWYFSRFYQFDKTQILILISVCFIVPAFEMMNTSVERTVKNPYPDRYLIAGEAKDTAAGAVLVAAIGAFLVGIVLFYDIAIIKEIISYFADNILHSIALVLSFIASYIFITADKYFKK